MRNMSRQKVVTVTIEMAERLHADVWKIALRESRALRESLSQDDDYCAELLGRFSVEIGLVATQIQLYYDCVLAGKTGTRTTVEDKKPLILSVRNCLRFGISALSVQDLETRHLVQTQFVHNHKVQTPLFAVLSSEKADTKTRQFASRFLSNLVTSNAKTAFLVLSSLDIAPDSGAVQRRLVHAVEQAADPVDSELSFHEETSQTTSWLDILIASGSSGNRELMATVVAVLYNSLIVIPRDKDTFSGEFAESGLVVSTLLRHLLSSQRVTASLRVDAAAKTVDALDDEATEWISNLLIMFVHRGYLRLAYESIGPVESVLPEQVAFLFCIRNHLDQLSNQDELFSDQNSSTEGISFFALLYSKTRLLADTDVSDGSDHLEMAKVVQLEVMEILASYLGNQTENACTIRNMLGIESTIIQELSTDLANVYDKVAIRNNGKVARDMYLSEEEQRMLILIVRTLGNLAFECPQNQDLIRTIAVARPGDPQSNSRTCLHVLISTTSLAHKCFTLREWGLVALRYLMESNEENQKVLAELEAQQPVQSAEVNALGIRIDMDQKGNVKVVPSGEKLDSVPE